MPESARQAGLHTRYTPCSKNSAHVSHIPTADLFSVHKIQDPVQTLIDRMHARLHKLQSRAARSDQTPSTGQGHSDVTVLPQSRGDHVRGSVTVPSATLESQQKEHHCMHYAATFASQHALHTHVAKMHREMVPRFVPSEFHRELHAKDGMPTCTACHMEFKLWKGLRNHLLSGACPEPSTLRDITQSADQQSHNHEMQKLQHLKKQVQGSPRSALGTVACIQTHGCCSTDVFLWLLDAGSHKGEIPYTPGTSQGLAIRRSPGPSQICAGQSAQMIKGHTCPHCASQCMCVVLFQICPCWHRVHSETRSRGHGPYQASNLETRSLHLQETAEQAGS